jgi:hypothetical protein
LGSGGWGLGISDSWLAQTQCLWESAFFPSGRIKRQTLKGMFAAAAKSERSMSCFLLLWQGLKTTGGTNRLDLKDFNQHWVHVHVAVVTICLEPPNENHIRIDTPLHNGKSMTDASFGARLHRFSKLTHVVGKGVWQDGAVRTDFSKSVS